MNDYNDHQVLLANREVIEITGVKKIESLNGNEYVLDTVYGFLAINGDKLEIVNLSIESGTIMIKGVIKGLSYEQINKKKVPENNSSFLAKLFK